MTGRPEPQSHKFSPNVGQPAAAAWNLIFPAGTRVRYWPVADQDECFDTVTRSEAWELGHGEVVVKIEGWSGGVAIAHLALLSDPRKLSAPNVDRDYGLPDSKPVGAPTWARIEDQDAPCPNCGAQLCDVEVHVEMELLRGGKGLSRYLGCPACPFASPAVVTSDVSRDPAPTKDTTDD